MFVEIQPLQFQKLRKPLSVKSGFESKCMKIVVDQAWFGIIIAPIPYAVCILDSFHPARSEQYQK